MIPQVLCRYGGLMAIFRLGYGMWADKFFGLYYIFELYTLYFNNNLSHIAENTIIKRRKIFKADTN